MQQIDINKHSQEDVRNAEFIKKFKFLADSFLAQSYSDLIYVKIS